MRKFAMMLVALAVAGLFFFVGRCLATERTHTIKAGSEFLGNVSETVNFVAKTTQGKDGTCVVNYKILTPKGSAPGKSILAPGASMNLRGAKKHSFLIRLNCIEGGELEVILQ